MSKVNYKELRRKFIKSNKVRRQRIAELAGYKTAEEYLHVIETGMTAARFEEKSALLEEKPKAKKKSKKASKSSKKSKSETSSVDMVIAFDTTGSMASYIEAVRRRVVDMIEDLFDEIPDLRLKIVAFGDYCDMRSKTNFGKAYQETKLTSDKQRLINFVKTARNTSGGDGDEFYELVLHKILRETPWRSEAKKSIFLIGDAKPHPVGYSYGSFVRNNQIDWKEEAELAARMGVQIDTLRIYLVDFYKKLSKMTNGVCMEFRSQKNTSEIIKGLAYARGSEAAFTASYTAAMDSGDEELIGAYKSMSTLL